MGLEERMDGTLSIYSRERIWITRLGSGNGIGVNSFVATNFSDGFGVVVVAGDGGTIAESSSFVPFVSPHSISRPTRSLLERVRRKESLIAL